VDVAAAGPAERISDHRLAYLDYEGPVSGGRGTVACEDRGEYHALDLSAGRVVVELQGAAVRGRMEMTHVDGDRWRAQFFATAGPDGAAAARGSIAPP
jgi:hypothetical protein